MRAINKKVLQSLKKLHEVGVTSIEVSADGKKEEFVFNTATKASIDKFLRRKTRRRNIGKKYFLQNELARTSLVEDVLKKSSRKKEAKTKTPGEQLELFESEVTQ